MELPQAKEFRPVIHAFVLKTSIMSNQQQYLKTQGD